MFESVVKAERLLDVLPRPRPALDGMAPVDVFAARIESPRVAASLARIECLADLPTAVMRYLDAHALPHEAALQPAAELRALGLERHQHARTILMYLDDYAATALGPRSRYTVT